MTYWLFHQWAPRWMRLWVWALIISVIAGGPWGLVAGIGMGIFAVPIGLFYHFMVESWEWSAENGSLLGARPSDKIRMSEKYRL